MQKSHYFKLERIGFSQNPFSALSKQDWGKTAFIPDLFYAALFESPSHIQLIGSIGSGKTALLHRIIEQKYESELNVSYEYVPQGQRKFTAVIDQTDLFLLDEAQRLNWWWRRRWLQMLKSSKRLRTIFSSHQDLSPYFKKYELPLITLQVDEMISPSYYAQWLGNRLRFFATGSPSQVVFSEEAILFLYETFQKDMRAAEYFLYEVFEDLETAVTLTAPYLADQLVKYPKVPSLQNH